MLTNVSTLRVFTGFFFNTQATTWFTTLGMCFLVTLSENGPLTFLIGPINFMGYVSLALVIVSGIGIPILFFYGKDMRRWTSGKVAKQPRQKWAGDEP